jgi:hypothetical protein
VCGANCTTLQLGGSASTLFNYQFSGTTRYTMSTNNFSPATDLAVDIGTASIRFSNIYANNIRSGTSAAADTTGTTFTALAQNGGAASVTGVAPAAKRF